MKKYISYIGDRFFSININSEEIMGGTFGYPIISCMNTVDKDEHIEVINLGDSNTDFNGIKNDIVKIGIVAGYTNIVLDCSISEQMSSIFEYIVYNTNENDEIYIDITFGNRFLKFALAFSAKYLSEVKNIKCKIVKAKNDTNIVEDVSFDYLKQDMMSLIVQFLINEGCINDSIYNIEKLKTESAFDSIFTKNPIDILQNKI